MLDLGTLRVGIKADTDGATKDLKGFQQELGATQEKAKKASADIESAKSKVLDTFGGIATAAKVGLAAATTAFVGLVTTSTKGYADYEQNIGGINKLFGDSAKQLQQYASNAWQTVGVSANQYMAQVTSFSASLISSLGGDTAQAAEYANQAMVDMADNANTFGTSIDSIQQAYQGFAKQNYIMLDNLKLGYGGTKTEMERLIADANKVKEANGEMADLSIDSFADVTEAIHIMQEQMGIAGTTAKEASTTISGSFNAMKAAWDNFLTSLGTGDESQIQASVDALVQSVGTFMGNLIPVVKTVAEEAFKQIPEVLDGIVAQLPEPIQQLVSLIEGILPIVTGVVTAIVAAVGALKFSEWLTNVTTGVQALFTLLAANPIAGVIIAVAAVAAALATLYATNEDFRNSVNSLFETITTIAQPAIEAISALIQQFIADAQPVVQAFLEFVTTAFTQIANFLSTVIPPALTVLQAIWDAVFPSLQTVAQAAFTIIQTVIQTAMTVITNVIQLATNLISGNWSGAWQNIQNIASTVWNAIKTVVSTAINAVKSVISNVLNGIKSLWDSAWNGLKSIVSTAFDNIRNAASQGIDAVLGFVRNLPSGIVNALGNVGSLLWNAGSSIMSGLLDGIKSGVQGVFDFVSGIAGRIAELKGPIPYDLKLLIPNGKAIMTSLASGLAKGFPEVEKEIRDITDQIGGFDYGSVRVERGFDAYRGSLAGGAVEESRRQTPASITVNNYSPKALDEVESARQFRRAAREYAFTA